MKPYVRLTIVLSYFILFYLYFKLLSQDYRDESRPVYSPAPTPQKLCPNNGKDLKIIILIKSAPKNIERRKSIRETWANVQRIPEFVRVAFVLGLGDNFLDTTTQESVTHGDIIQGYFIDTYYNLTLKGFHAFSWLNIVCREVPYVLYCHDDMYVNVSSLLEFLDRRGQTQNTFFGYVVSNAIPVRDTHSKYFVTMEDYPASIYPNYTMGSGYVLTGDLIFKLYFAAAMSKLFKLDDVFYTGLIASSLNSSLVHVPEFCIVYEKLNNSNCIIRSTFNQPAKQYEFHFH